MSATRERTEADVERVRMALAEAGYPDWTISFVHLVEMDGQPDVLRMPGEVSRWDAWKAQVLAGSVRICWPCARDANPAPYYVECDHPIDPFCAEDAS